jgi:hypothetical protein
LIPSRTRWRRYSTAVRCSIRTTRCTGNVVFTSASSLPVI